MNRKTRPDDDQPDLFGHWDAEQQRKAADAARLAAWSARFRRVPVTVAYESASGMKPGQILDGIVCPACGGIEFNDLLLSINHGWSPCNPKDSLYGQPAFDTCTRLQWDAESDHLDGIGVVRLETTRDDDRDES